MIVVQPWNIDWIIYVPCNWFHTFTSSAPGLTITMLYFIGKMSSDLSLSGIALSSPHSSDINAYLPLTPPTTPGLSFLESCTIKHVPSGINPITTFGPSIQRGPKEG